MRELYFKRNHCQYVCMLYMNKSFTERPGYKQNTQRLHRDCVHPEVRSHAFNDGTAMERPVSAVNKPRTEDVNELIKAMESLLHITKKAVTELEDKLEHLKSSAANKK